MKIVHPQRWRKRALLGLAGTTLLAGTARAGIDPGVGQDDAAAWAAFKHSFLSDGGRVVDTGNHGVSHTEGQGWGLLFAATFDDQVAFNRMLDWTTRTLRRPGDALHSWRYVPEAANPVPDLNNATDGDLFIAFALTRAAARWRRPELASRADAIARSILSRLVHTVHGQTLLAPGIDGFQTGNGLVVNPSYYAFTAMDALAQLHPARVWAALRRDGAAAVAKSSFGRWQLPADWVLAADDGSFAPASDHPPRFGYDAIRVPLYLAWAGIESPVLAAVARWWGHAPPGEVPAWVDLMTGTVADYAAGPGMAAVMELATGATSPLPAITGGMDYYTAALCLLTRVAVRDISARRTAAGPR